jgi:hypothetical protein
VLFSMLKSGVLLRDFLMSNFFIIFHNIKRKGLAIIVVEARATGAIRGSPPTYMNRFCDWWIITMKHNKTQE